jgi:hypothetical protein
LSSSGASVIAMRAQPPDGASANIPMPRLSDDAVVHIHDFIEHVLDLFEACYGDQLHRFYEDRSAYNIIETGPLNDIDIDPDDPPF